MNVLYGCVGVGGGIFWVGEGGWMFLWVSRGGWRYFLGR